MVERTLIVIKPDAVERAIVGDIISRFERVGLKVAGAKMLIVPKELANKHYPQDRTEFITGLGNKTLTSYKELDMDPFEHMGTDDPHKIGLKVHKWLVEQISSGPVIAMVLEGPHAIEVVRKICGVTLPSKAAPGTIRGDYSFDSSAYANNAKRPIRNLIHASGDKEEADLEVGLWFKPEELYDYSSVHNKHMTN